MWLIVLATILDHVTLLLRLLHRRYPTTHTHCNDISEKLTCLENRLDSLALTCFQPTVRETSEELLTARAKNNAMTQWFETNKGTTLGLTRWEQWLAATPGVHSDVVATAPQTAYTLFSIRKITPSLIFGGKIQTYWEQGWTWSLVVKCMFGKRCQSFPLTNGHEMPFLVNRRIIDSLDTFCLWFSNFSCSR